MQPYTTRIASTRYSDGTPADLIPFIAAAGAHCAQRRAMCEVCRTVAAAVEGEIIARKTEPWRGARRGRDLVRMVTSTLYHAALPGYRQMIRRGDPVEVADDYSARFRGWVAGVAVHADEVARLEATLEG